MSRKTSMLREKDFPPLASALCDMPLEYDRKEKFKMVIGKSKKETQETEPRETQQECEITVDAAAAAAILQAATRGIKRSSQSSHVNLNSTEGRHPGDLGGVPPSQPDNAVEKLSQNGSHNVSASASERISRAIAVEAAGEADSSEAHLTKEQKLKAERLKRAKMFVAMLKSGEVPFKPGKSRSTSLEPLESGVSRSASGINLDDKEREASLAPADVGSPATDEKPPTNYFGEDHTDRLSKRKYRSRQGGCEDDDEDDVDVKEHEERHSRKKFRSRSRRHDEDDENDNAVEMEQKHHRRRNQTHSSSEENEDENGSSEERRDHKNDKLKHRSHHSQEDDECEDKCKEDKNHRRSRKKHHSHRSSREHSRKRRSSKQYLQDEDEHDDHGGGKKQSRKKHHSSHHSRDKHRHKSRRSSRGKESRHNVKHDTSSNDEHQDNSMNEHKKELYDEKDELEEGEISSRVSEESRRTASGRISRETSVDVSFHQGPPSQPSDATTEVPDDLRAKIRAMLMETL
ncbi:hypothetical protein CDL12_25327 [Handroanthus impetiginosus]|uniref:Uncharacterized protein n=1 Tax=Handroanthus impetiginosus TaxID=429701 RepID=A0A2G9GAA9_9LAMI|nr:hypothetical protein CDL12_25327 [Handroanthus impetiginosus]